MANIIMATTGTELPTWDRWTYCPVGDSCLNCTSTESYVITEGWASDQFGHLALWVYTKDLDGLVARCGTDFELSVSGNDVSLEVLGNTVVSTQDFYFDRWISIIVNYEGGEYKLYIDGEEEESITATSEFSQSLQWLLGEGVCRLCGIRLSSFSATAQDISDWSTQEIYNSFDLISSNTSEVTVGQRDLTLIGQGFERELGVPVDNTSYAYWELSGNASDYLGNYANAVWTGDAYYPTARGTKYAEVRGNNRVEMPIGGSGYDFRGLTGNAGTNLNTVSITFNVDALPPLESDGATMVDRAWLWGCFGDEVHVGIGVTKDGAVFYERRSGIYSEIAQTPDGVVSPGEYHAACATYNHASPASSGIIVDGTFYQLSNQLAVIGDIDVPATIGEGNIWAPGTTYIDAEWDADFPAADSNYVVDGLDISRPSGGGTWRTARINSSMEPDSGVYYWEAYIVEFLELHIGVCTTDLGTNGSPNTKGLVLNCKNGYRYDFAGGGGTNWTSAIPEGSTMGFVLDMDAGTFEILVNGVSRGVMPGTTLTQEMTFAIGSECNTEAIGVQLNISSDDWVYTAPAGAQEIPQIADSDPIDESERVFIPGLYGRVRMANIIDSTENRARLGNPNGLGVDLGGEECQVLRIINDGSVEVKVPSISPGTYDLSLFGYVSDEETAPIPITVGGMDILDSTLNISTFTQENLEEHFYPSHSQWGGDNGGIVRENVTLDGETVRIRAHGDDYVAGLLGTNKLGQPENRQDRVGGCLVTKKYIPYSKIDVWASLGTELGACWAIWTFHYEEVYPEDDNWQELIDEGLDPYPGEDPYNVRNHEIDIEIPTGLKSDLANVSWANGRFNAWHGEKGGEYVDEFVNHSVVLTDGQVHKYTIDWHETYIDFFLDDVFVQRLTTFIPNIPGRLWIGWWFPSWAGGAADWEVQDANVTRILITPHQDEVARDIGESYPMTGVTSFLKP